MIDKRATVSLGSTSAVKHAAVVAVLRDLGWGLDVADVAAASRVPAQPYGDEILRGAENRAVAAFRARGDSLFAIGIENGLHTLRDGRVVDVAVAVVTVSTPDHDATITATSFEVAVPGAAVAHLRTMGPEATWGDAAAALWGCDPKDPQAYVTSGEFPRQVQIQAAVSTALRCAKGLFTP